MIADLQNMNRIKDDEISELGERLRQTREMLSQTQTASVIKFVEENNNKDNSPTKPSLITSTFYSKNSKSFEPTIAQKLSSLLTYHWSQLGDEIVDIWNTDREILISKIKELEGRMRDDKYVIKDGKFRIRDGK